MTAQAHDREPEASGNASQKDQRAQHGGGGYDPEQHRRPEPAIREQNGSSSQPPQAKQPRFPTSSSSSLEPPNADKSASDMSVALSHGRTLIGGNRPASSKLPPRFAITVPGAPQVFFITVRTVSSSASIFVIRNCGTCAMISVRPAHASP